MTVVTVARTMQITVVARKHLYQRKILIRFVREYDFRSISPQEEVRNLIELPMMECHDGFFTVVGNISVTIKTELENTFDVMVHPEDTIREVISLRYLYGFGVWVGGKLIASAGARINLKL